jgi:FixJ family two-component response regulator
MPTEPIQVVLSDKQRIHIAIEALLESVDLNKDCYLKGNDIMIYEDLDGPLSSTVLRQATPLDFAIFKAINKLREKL